MPENFTGTTKYGGGSMPGDRKAGPAGAHHARGYTRPRLLFHAGERSFRRFQKEMLAVPITMQFAGIGAG
jgi:hypothetical protein